MMPLPHSYSPLFLFLRRGGGAAPFGESEVAFFRPAHPQGDTGNERLAALSLFSRLQPTSLDPKEKEKEGKDNGDVSFCLPQGGRGQTFPPLSDISRLALPSSSRTGEKVLCEEYLSASVPSLIYIF